MKSDRVIKYSHIERPSVFSTSNSLTPLCSLEKSENIFFAWQLDKTTRFPFSWFMGIILALTAAGSWPAFKLGKGATEVFKSILIGKIELWRQLTSVGFWRKVSPSSMRPHTPTAPIQCPPTHCKLHIFDPEWHPTSMTSPLLVIQAPAGGATFLQPETANVIEHVPTCENLHIACHILHGILTHF